MEIIRTGYTKYLNMFKSFVLTCGSYTRRRRTLFKLIVIVIARMPRNDLPNEHESCQMVNSYSFAMYSAQFLVLQAKVNYQNEATEKNFSQSSQ